MQVHPRGHKWQGFLLLKGWIIFHCMHKPHFLYPFVHLRTFRLLAIVIMLPILDLKPSWCVIWMYCFPKVKAPQRSLSSRLSIEEEEKQAKNSSKLYQIPFSLIVWPSRLWMMCLILLLYALQILNIVNVLCPNRKLLFKKKMKNHNTVLLCWERTGP